MPRSLRGRLLVLVLGMLGAVWLVSAVATWLDVRHELRELLDGHLAQAAALLVVQQSREIGDDDDHRVDAPTLHRYAPRVAFQVFHEGRLALRSAQAPSQPMTGAAGDFREGFRSVQIDGVAWRVFAARGAGRDLQVYVGERADSRDAILWAVLRSTWWPVLLTLPLLAAGAWWAVVGGLAPLRRLGHTLAARQPQALDPVVVDGAPSEMAPMVAALNGLLGRIGAMLESERRFTADAAHELRTPIAAIRTQAQVALAEADDAARRHALQATLAGCDRATRVVEQLLTLARLEAASAAPAGRADLAGLLRAEAAALAPQALARGQTLEVDAPPQAAVAGDATLLAVLLRNLLDNAVRYSPRGAAVHATLATDDGGTRLCIEDGGPGLDEAARARLGERFFRVLGGGEPGSGLGWSIVRRIAAVHGSTVEVGRSAALGGLAVTLQLPATAGAQAEGDAVPAGMSQL